MKDYKYVNIHALSNVMQYSSSVKKNQVDLNTLIEKEDHDVVNINVAGKYMPF